MNNTFKYLILSTLVLVMMSSASAMFNDLNVWDENGARHANRGEDFNIIISDAYAVSDINSDANYLVALSYSDSRGTMYLDLNVNVFSGLSAIDVNGDGNTWRKTISGSGPCENGGEWQILQLADSSAYDSNTFNIGLTVPLTVPKAGPDINSFIGKPVLVEIWALVDTDMNNATCGRKVADGNFIIGPAIIIKTPNVSGMVAKIDQNILIMGFGFSPSNPIAPDNNVLIKIYDANGVDLNALKYITDTNEMNVRKGTGADPLVGRFHKNRSSTDTNGLAMSWYGPAILASAERWWTADWNGVWIYPDANGEFDVNLTIPYVSNSAGSTIGRSDLNTLRAYSSSTGDVNGVFIIAPKITTSADMNATVTVNGLMYTIENAFFQRLVTDFNSVSNIIIRMGSIVAGATTPARRQIEVLFNSNVNFKKTPVANYGTDMNGMSGFVDINTVSLSEYIVDANINMYNVNITGAAMPFILKDNKPCASTVCTNQDGTTLSAASAWSYNPTGGDGNLSFRASGFSSYQASPFDLQVQVPNGGEKIRIPRHGADANYTIQFRFKDLNTLDNNKSNMPLRGIIYYATKSGAKTGVIINDFNLFDTIGIRCNGWSNVTDDVNLAQWVTCVFDLNKADLNIFGEFVVDVNIASHAGKPIEQSILDSSDANLFFNPPLIEITDANLNTVSNFQISPGKAVADINYIVDFNIYLPDINRDQNFALSDYNIHFYLGATQTSMAIGSGASDLNVLGVRQQFDQNLHLINEGWDSNAASDFNGVNIQCITPPEPFLDYKCTLQYDTNGVFENKSYIVARILNNMPRTTRYGTVSETGAMVVVNHVIDTNELWDVNASTLQASINDSNRPRARFSQNYGTTSIIVNGSSYNLTLSCDDNTSGAASYYTRQPSGNWASGSSFTVQTPNKTKEEIVTYYGGCLDYASNASDMNATLVLTFRPEGGGGTTPGGGGGGAPAPATEGTETIVLVERHGTPNASAVEAVLSEAGFSGEQVAAAMRFAVNNAIDQKIVVDKTTTATGSTYRTAVSIKVTNHSAKKWKDVKVIAEVPKALATDASLVKSSTAMRALKADPIIEFTIPEIQVGESGEIIYYISKSISDITANAVPLGMVTAYSQAEPCDGVICESTACATGTCNSTTGKCEYVYEADGTGCGVNKECKAGTCVGKAVPPAQPAQPPAQPAAPDYTLPITAVVIIILVVAGAAYYMKKGKRKGR